VTVHVAVGVKAEQVQRGRARPLDDRLPHVRVEDSPDSIAWFTSLAPWAKIRPAPRALWPTSLLPMSSSRRQPDGGSVGLERSVQAGVARRVHRRRRCFGHRVHRAGRCVTDTVGDHDEHGPSMGERRDEGVSSSDMLRGYAVMAIRTPAMIISPRTGAMTRPHTVPIDAPFRRVRSRPTRRTAGQR
jgi:hypothetical protein